VIGRVLETVWCWKQPSAVERDQRVEHCSIESLVAHAADDSCIRQATITVQREAKM